MKYVKSLVCALTLSAALIGAATTAQAGPREDIIASFGAGPGNAAMGKIMFETNYGTGKPSTPRCATCHTSSPLQMGQTRTGKAIQPMAVSRTPDRFTDAAKVAKWFKRNCSSVIGRLCTPQEKVDYITYMVSQ
ncbi:MAG: DUF1924 domain-containing protein [Magnetovibrio sp.]|nr:DUF1924 domain-containing protein [Magnetovibrio sp.]